MNTHIPLTRMLLVVTMCASLLASPLTHAQTFDWEVERERNGITIATSKVAGSKFKAVKATMQLETTLTQLVALVQDAEACPEWAALCKKAQVIESMSPTEMYVHTLNDLPWPVSDRDAVAHVIWTQHPETLAVTMTATVDGDKIPKRKKAIRITYGKTSWTFTPMEDGEVRVESLAHIDPAGATPAWLTNQLLVDSPYDTMRDMRKLVQTGRYAASSFDFIIEP